MARRSRSRQDSSRRRSDPAITSTRSMNWRGNPNPEGQARPITSSQSSSPHEATLSVGIARGPRQPEHRAGLQRRPDSRPALDRRDPGQPSVQLVPFARPAQCVNQQIVEDRADPRLERFATDRLQGRSPIGPRPSGGRRRAAGQLADRRLPAPRQQSIVRLEFVVRRDGTGRHCDFHNRPVGISGRELPP